MSCIFSWELLRVLALLREKCTPTEKDLDPDLHGKTFNSIWNYNFIEGDRKLELNYGFGDALCCQLKKMDCLRTETEMVILL